MWMGRDTPSRLSWWRSRSCWCQAHFLKCISQMLFIPADPVNLQIIFCPLLAWREQKGVQPEHTPPLVVCVFWLNCSLSLCKQHEATQQGVSSSALVLDIGLVYSSPDFKIIALHKGLGFYPLFTQLFCDRIVVRWKYGCKNIFRVESTRTNSQTC